MHSRRWSAASHRACRERRRSQSLPLRSQLLGLDWAGTQTTLERFRERLGSISKQGDRHLRSLFVTGALAVIRYAKLRGTRHRPWLTALLARRPTKVGQRIVECELLTGT